MSSNVKNFGNLVLDVRNERDDFNVKSKPIIEDVNEKLISSEMGININSLSKSRNESFTITSSMDTEKDKTKDENVGSRNKGDNKDTDSYALNQNEYDARIDERLPETVTLLTTPDGGKLYLVGTAHFSLQSINDVSMIIQAVQPHIVVVELCKDRVGILQMDEETIDRYAKKLTYQCIVETLKDHGVYSGLLYILLLRMMARISEELGVAPGGEFRRACEEAKKVPNCIIQLADRPFNVTMQRAVRSLSWWQTIKLGWYLLRMKDHVTKEYVESCKKRSLLDDMISQLKEEYPPIEEVFVKERDLYLTYSLQVACMSQRTLNGIISPRVVGIVGIGHTPGIMKNWGKVEPSDIPPILRIPPQSLSSKILRFTVKVSLLSAIIYTGYKILPVPSVIKLQSIKSLVGGLLKVSVEK